MFTQKQINELLNNKNVHRCSSKSITFTGKFKLEAIRKYYKQGSSPSIIFQEAGINIDKNRAQDCLVRWRRSYGSRGNTELMKEHRGRNGGRPQTKFDDDKDTIKHLKTKIAYLKEENRLLKKMEKFGKP